MAEPVEVLTHAADGVANLASQYRDAVNLQHFLNAALAEVQTLEGVAFDIYERTLAAATGDMLDLYGALAGVARQGFTDDVYRRLVLAEFLVLTSNGLSSQLAAIVTRLTDPDEEYSPLYREYWPAQVSFEYVPRAPSAAFRALITAVVQRAAPAGVLVDPIVETGGVVSGDIPFGHFDDDSAAGFGVGHYVTITGASLGSTFYYDLADGYHEAKADVDVGDALGITGGLVGDGLP